MYSAYDRNENRYCALKVPKDGEERLFNECLQNEVRILPDCSESQYICKYYSHGIATLKLNGDQEKIDIPFLALELCESGEVFDFIASGGRLSERHARYHFKKLVSAVEHVHSKGHSHRDLKLQNMLFTRNK